MLGAQFMQDETERRMELVRLLCILTAPMLSGRYKGRFSRPDAIETGVNERGAAYSRLSNDATSDEGFMYGLAVEVGNEHVEAHHTMYDALHQAARD